MNNSSLELTSMESSMNNSSMESTMELSIDNVYELIEKEYQRNILLNNHINNYLKKYKKRYMYLLKEMIEKITIIYHFLYKWDEKKKKTDDSSINTNIKIHTLQYKEEYIDNTVNILLDIYINDYSLNNINDCRNGTSELSNNIINESSDFIDILIRIYMNELSDCFKDNDINDQILTDTKHIFIYKKYKKIINIEHYNDLITNYDRENILLLLLSYDNLFIRKYSYIIDNYDEFINHIMINHNMINSKYTNCGDKVNNKIIHQSFPIPMFIQSNIFKMNDFSIYNNNIMVINPPSIYDIYLSIFDKIKLICVNHNNITVLLIYTSLDNKYEHNTIVELIEEKTKELAHNNIKVKNYDDFNYRPDINQYINKQNYIEEYYIDYNGVKKNRQKKFKDIVKIFSYNQ